MIEINFSSYELDTPLGRQTILLKIPPERAVVQKYHTELLELFRREISYRRSASPSGDGESDCFEQIYWCGLLLYLVGDPADVPLMWEAKNANMDTGSGFDGQFLVGAGVDETIMYLEVHGQKPPADYLKELKSLREFDDLPGWESFRIHYFYPDIPLQENAG